MNKKIKIKLYRTFPNQFHDSLYEITQTYKYGQSEEKKAEDKIELEEIIGKNFSKKFADYLKDRFNCYLRLDDNTPAYLRTNPEFIDWIAHNNRYCIRLISDDMMKPEYIKLFEDYLTANKKELYLHDFGKENVSRKVLSSRIVIDVVVELFKENDSSYTKRCIINNYSFNKYALDRLLEASNFSEVYDSYNELNYQVHINEIYITKMLHYNILSILDVPEEKYSFALNYLLTNINNNTIKLEDICNKISYDHQHRHDRKLLDKEIAGAIIRQYNTFYKDNKDILKSLRDVFITDFFDIYSLDVGDRYFVYNLIKDLATVQLKVEKYKNDSELLQYTINKGDYCNITFFSIPTIENNFSLILQKYKENSISESTFNTILIYTATSIIVLKALLEESLINEDFFNTIGEKLAYYTEPLNNLEAIPLFKDLLKKGYDKYLLNNIMRSAYYNNSEILDFIIDNKMTEYLDYFPGHTYTDEIISKAISIIPLIKLTEKVGILRVENNFKVNSEQEFDDILELNSNNDTTYIMLILASYANTHNIKSPRLSRINEKIAESKRIKSESNPNYTILIDKILNKELKVETYIHMFSSKTERYVIKMGDILDSTLEEYINTIPDEILDNLNAKHILKIRELTQIIEPDYSKAAMLSIKMYCVIGFEKARELLTGIYGPITKEQLQEMFYNISLIDIPFKKEGKKIVPDLNNTLLNLIFGANRNVTNTPIRNYLNDNKEKKEEMSQKRAKINASVLEENEKQEQLNAIDEVEKKYIEENGKFFENLSQAFNNWDIIEEEFLKAKNREKLKIKLNSSRINKIISHLKAIKKRQKLTSRDSELAETDILDYVGVDTQYTKNPETAFDRTLYLSRDMDNVGTKRFPNVEIKKGEYKLSVYGPQDRNILSAGYKSHCCFRPNGNADDEGRDTSLLRYCTSTTYGGGVYITNEAGEMMMFSPLLRNGNVLMIHSFESAKTIGEKRTELTALLIEYAEETIRKAEEAGDDISFVVMTNLHEDNIDLNLIKGSLPSEKKFGIFDDQNKFKGMYNNLGNEHLILASKKGATFEDIHYGKETKEYEYPVRQDYTSIDLNPEINIDLKRLDLLKERIIVLSNKKEVAKTEKKYDEMYEVEKTIKMNKKEYLSLYKKVLSIASGKDIFEQYKKAIDTVKKVCQDNNTLVPENIKRIIVGKGWYIVITEDGKLIGDCLSYAKEVYDRMLKYNLGFYPNLIPFPNGIQDSNNTNVITETISNS